MVDGGDKQNTPTTTAFDFIRSAYEIMMIG
jgi:hypothetical protein